MAIYAISGIHAGTNSPGDQNDSVSRVTGINVGDIALIPDSSGNVKLGSCSLYGVGENNTDLQVMFTSDHSIGAYIDKDSGGTTEFIGYTQTNKHNPGPGGGIQINAGQDKLIQLYKQSFTGKFYSRVVENPLDTETSWDQHFTVLNPMDLTIQSDLPTKIIQAGNYTYIPNFGDQRSARSETIYVNLAYSDFTVYIESMFNPQTAPIDSFYTLRLNVIGSSYGAYNIVVDTGGNKCYLPDAELVIPAPYFVPRNSYFCLDILFMGGVIPPILCVVMQKTKNN